MSVLLYPAQIALASNSDTVFAYIRKISPYPQQTKCSKSCGKAIPARPPNPRMPRQFFLPERFTMNHTATAAAATRTTAPRTIAAIAPAGSPPPGSDGSCPGSDGSFPGFDGSCPGSDGSPESTVTTADALFSGSKTDTAVTVNDSAVSPAPTVSMPFPSIFVAGSDAPLIFHPTEVSKLPSPSTSAVNCSVLPRSAEAVVGVTETDMTALYSRFRYLYESNFCSS